MKYVIVACEALRPELEYIMKNMEESPEIIYMEQELHNEPDRMRNVLQEKITQIENERPELEAIVMAFGLCGRGTSGVKTSKIPLIYPRVHDCVPLYMGLPQKETSKLQEGKLCLGAGALQYGKIAQHLTQGRYQIYVEKFGEARAKRLIKAENSVFANYKSVCHILWPELGEKFEELARNLASEINLPYEQQEGKLEFLGELLKGGQDDHFFLRLVPGQTLDMDTDGEIIAI